MTEQTRLVIITGGTGGLGVALAKQYLAAGNDVVITGRDESKLRAVKAELDMHKQLHIYKLDVTDNEAVRAFAAWIKIRFNRCDILVNNAGTAVFKPFAEHSPEEMREIFRVNVDAPFYMTRAFLPMMQAAKRGHIVNIASLAGRVATAKASVYAASKAAVIRFSEGLRHELTGSGVYVTCVMPGPIDTPFLHRADTTGQYREKVRRFLLSPEKTAHAIVRAVDAKRAEVSMPFLLSATSSIFFLLPSRLKRWLSPVINRK
jgi:short-subunit dehydrogenase